MTRRRWRLRASLAGLLSLGMLASASTPGAAAPPTNPTTPSVPRATTPAGTSGGSGQPIATTKVTLITGDVVTVGVTADKKVTATVSTVAPRADGSHPTFLQITNDDAHYVYPSDAVALIEAGKLDSRLFDVNYLAVNGYADAQTSTLPLIVQYHQPSRAAQDAGRGVRDLATQTDALPGTATPRVLNSINAAATAVDRKQTNQLWTKLTGTGRGVAVRAIDQGMSKIWLDAKVKVNLDASVPQIGAPAAWDAGYTGDGVKVAILDTGVDPNHPDLAGKITTSQSFVPDEEVQDGHGHGTHVASTVAGSGAAAGGKYKGVAPDVDLMIGKVLSNRGSGSYAMVVAGMEWAAANGADIISMSLSATDLPGLDPQEQAVENLSDQYGTLFVVAAGNNGGTDRTIGSPGSAPSALTVAAVDKQDQLASFSSRGPTVDFALKPDIAAPGVDIAAARAAGTTMGTPVDDLYTKASGTSMATPHVAGAAAILAQQHPEWTGQQLKAVLTESAVDTPATVLQEGAGRVDVARAITATVSGDGPIYFGQVAYPHNKPVTRTLTYTNTGDTPVTLNLAASIDSRTGPAPDGTLTVDKSTVEVPANGTAAVTVALDFAGDRPDTWYSGIITATGTDGVAVRTAVGAFKSPKKGKVTVKTISSPNMPGMTFGAFGITRVDERTDLDSTYVLNGAPEISTGVMIGTFSVIGSVGWYDTNGVWNALPVSAPEFTVDGDTTVTIDLRKATPLKVRTPKPTNQYRTQGGIQRTSEGGITTAALNFVWLPDNAQMWSLPTTNAITGTFFTFSQHVLGAPPISMTSDGLTLSPRYYSIDALSSMIDGEHRLTVVSGGTGTAEDLAKVDAKGKLVLLDLSDLCPAIWCDPPALDRVVNAHAAGAAAVLYHGTTGRQWLPLSWSSGHPRIPLLSLPADEGRALAAAISERTVRITAKGVADSPYIYALSFYQRDQIPARPNLSVDKRNLVEFDNRLHMDEPGHYVNQWLTRLHVPGVDDRTGYSLDLNTRSQVARTEYVGPVADDVNWTRYKLTGKVTSWSRPFSRELGAWQNSTRRYTEPGRHTQNWGQHPFTPGAPALTPEQRVPGQEACFDCRLGDLLHPRFANVNGDGIKGNATWSGNPEDLRLFQGDREIPMKVYQYFSALPTFAVPAGPETYRMTSTFRSTEELQKYGREIDTEWAFRSERPDPQEPGSACYLMALFPESGKCQVDRKLFLDYDPDLALDNTARAGRLQFMSVSGYHDSFTDPRSKLTSLTMEVSYDSGATWKRVPAIKIRDSYQVSLWHPPLRHTDGTVSLRTSAKDADGNTIKQTIKQAYGLR